MKSTIVLCLLGLIALTCARPGDKYTDKYDSLDLKQILSNRRFLIPYLNCILEKGRCSAEGKELKSHIKEALETDCAKCTDAQRRGTNEVLEHLINHEPEYWNQLKAKYDPQNKYASKHEEELRKIKH